MEKYLYKTGEYEYIVTTYDYIVEQENPNFEELGAEYGYNSFEEWLADVPFWEAVPLLTYEGITFYTDTQGRYLSSLVFSETSLYASDVKFLLDNIEGDQDLPVNALHALVQHELLHTLDVIDLDRMVDVVKDGYIEDEEVLSEAEKEGNVLCCCLDNRICFYFKI